MGMEVRTGVDVVTPALRDLAVIPGDAVPDGFELENASATWRELAADLLDDGLIEFGPDEVPIDAFRACWRLLADVVAPSYGRQRAADPDDDLHPSRIRLLRRMSRSDEGETREIVEF